MIAPLNDPTGDRTWTALKRSIKQPIVRRVKGTVLVITTNTRFGVAVFGPGRNAHAAVQASVLAGEHSFAWDLAIREGLTSVMFRYVGNEVDTFVRRLSGHTVKLRIVCTRDAKNGYATARAFR